MVIPILQIRQTPGQLYIDADPGSFSLRQPKAELTINTDPGEVEIHQYKPTLEIDQSKAKAAYDGGNPFEMNQRIYSGVQQLFLQAIAQRVENGNRAGDIKNGGNTIASIYGEDWKPVPFPEMRGPASMKNVDIHFEVRAPEFNARRAHAEIDVKVNKPEIEYTRGKLDMYMKQYPSVQYIPPDIDLRK